MSLKKTSNNLPEGVQDSARAWGLVMSLDNAFGTFFVGGYHEEKNRILADGGDH